MGEWAGARNGKLDGQKESGSVTVHATVFGRVQRVQKVEETLNEFKRTHVVGRRMAGRTEWEIRRVEGEWDCDCTSRCVWEGPEGSYS